MSKYYTDSILATEINTINAKNTPKKFKICNCYEKLQKNQKYLHRYEECILLYNPDPRGLFYIIGLDLIIETP